MCKLNYLFLAGVMVKYGAVLDYIILRGDTNLLNLPMYIHKRGRIQETFLSMMLPRTTLPTIALMLVNKNKRYKFDKKYKLH